MKILEDEKKLSILPQQSSIDKELFLNWKQKRWDDWITAENNVVNRMVLGLDPLLYNEYPGIVEAAWTDTKLEEFQQYDVEKSVQLGDVLNRNSMGLGKTVEAIKTLQSWGAKDIVVIAPKAVCPQWKFQFEQWWPEISNIVELHNPNASVCVTNYEKLRNEQVLLGLRSRRHDAVVFDEIHKLKNKSAQQTKCAKLIPARCHIGLTGTPILSQPDDLWSILHALNWRYSGNSYWSFVDYFCDVEEGQYGSKITGVTKNEKRLGMLHKLLDLVTIHNADIDVAKGKRIISVQLDMSLKQAGFYKRIKNLVLDELPENCTIVNGASHALRMQQATSWPGLFDTNLAGVKFEWVLEFCKNTDEQVVVLTKFAKTAVALSKYLFEHGVKSTLYIGQQSERFRTTSKQEFTNGNVQVLIGTIGAVGTGVDGLQVARLGIMLERDWSPEINKQCEDRLNRKGQQRPVRWYYLECKKSFDQHVGKINLSKANAIREVLEAD